MAKASKARNDKTTARRIEDFRIRTAAAIPAAIIDKRTIRFSVSPRTAGNSPKTEQLEDKPENREEQKAGQEFLAKPAPGHAKNLK